MKIFLKIIFLLFTVFCLEISAFAQEVPLEIKNIKVGIGIDKKHKSILTADEFRSLQQRFGDVVEGSCKKTVFTQKDSDCVHAAIKKEAVKSGYKIGYIQISYKEGDLKRRS